MVEQVIKYSDGTETVIRYKKDQSVELSDILNMDQEVKQEEVETQAEAPSEEVASENIEA